MSCHIYFIDEKEKNLVDLGNTIVGNFIDDAEHYKEFKELLSKLENSNELENIKNKKISKMKVKQLSFLVNLAEKVIPLSWINSKIIGIEYVLRYCAEMEISIDQALNSICCNISEKKFKDYKVI